MTAIAARAAAIRSRRHRGLLRLLLVLLAALVLIGALTVAGLMLGAADLSADAMVRGLLGIGSRSENLIVQTLRLPRIEAALLAELANGVRELLRVFPSFGCDLVEKQRHGHSSFFCGRGSPDVVVLSPRGRCSQPKPFRVDKANPRRRDRRRRLREKPR